MEERYQNQSEVVEINRQKALLRPQNSSENKSTS